MKVEDLRFYGRPFSEAEASWPPELRKRMQSEAMAVVRHRLGRLEQLRFAFAFAFARRRMRQLDLSEFRQNGLTDETFIATQLDYLAFFAALTEVIGRDSAIEVAKEVMHQPASKEALLLCLPDPDDVRSAGQPFEVFREYLRAMPDAGRAGGCHAIDIAEDASHAFQFDVQWCVWLELARAAGVPEACIPNCYADDLVFPEYFTRLGIEYRRTQTLACGGSCCDFRFQCQAPPEK